MVPRLIEQYAEEYILFIINTIFCCLPNHSIEIYLCPKLNNFIYNSLRNQPADFQQILKILNYRMGIKEEQTGNIRNLLLMTSVEADILLHNSLIPSMGLLVLVAVSKFGFVFDAGADF